GRQRHRLVGTEGRRPGGRVHGADAPDRAGGADVLRCAKRDHPRPAHVWADGRAAGSFVDRAEARLGAPVAVGRQAEGGVGSVVRRMRRAVERTFVWLPKRRRRVRDYEGLPETTEAWIDLAMIRLYLRRGARFAD